MKLIFFKKKCLSGWLWFGFCKISMFVFKNFLLEINIENCRKKRKLNLELIMIWGICCLLVCSMYYLDIEWF